MRTVSEARIALAKAQRRTAIQQNCKHKFKLPPEVTAYVQCVKCGAVENND